ncbi:hypothetical protein JI721_12025 [Alicyclobacillus cycloheptanicus]|uniref:Uncharacterized protein n=1 Tax=Alicyclobacillus cycloheptanicus TaxID=1457 RepID=A0ABT9XLW8_9BACL|nr:hypothetical protein [Alicyclobacillus cycloheptanicus]MDQ0191280.1 hypothetical protein [Alicyclobacillus cycloheptanicus]WDM00446.1 hypothetical protein JI721_12025 [Alicyclobacillus cycloheptanicus]
MNNLLYGDILTAILLVATVLWDWKQHNFRGIVQQVLGAFCVGTVLNSIVNLTSHPDSAVKSLLLYLILSGVFYYWAFVRRNAKPKEDK